MVQQSGCVYLMVGTECGSYGTLEADVHSPPRPICGGGGQLAVIESVCVYLHPGVLLISVACCISLRSQRGCELRTINQASHSRSLIADYRLLITSYGLNQN